MAKRYVAVAAIATVALAGCGASGTANGDGDSTTVTVLTHDSFNLPQSLIDAFQEDTGYTLVTESAGDAGVANKLVLAAKNGKYDAVYGIDNYTAGVAQDAGVLETYTPADEPESATTYATDGLTPIDVGDVCVNTDHAWFTAHQMAEPTTLDDLAKPEYVKLLALINPADSTTGFAFLAGIQTAKGADADAYLTSLIKGGAKVASGWTEAYNQDFSAGEGKGDYPLVLSYASSPAETEGATGNVDASCVRQVEYAGVVKGGANTKGAKAFVDWMLSQDVQSAIPENMYMYPVDSSVKLPTAWATYAKLVDSPILPAIATVNEKRDAWLDSWAEIAG